MPVIHDPQLRALLLPLLLAVTFSLHGCRGHADDPHASKNKHLETEPPLATCPGADLAQITNLIYVAPDGKDSDSCGAQTATPCKTIAQGIPQSSRPRANPTPKVGERCGR